MEPSSDSRQRSTEPQPHRIKHQPGDIGESTYYLANRNHSIAGTGNAGRSVIERLDDSSGGDFGGQEPQSPNEYYFAAEGVLDSGVDLANPGVHVTVPRGLIRIGAPEFDPSIPEVRVAEGPFLETTAQTAAASRFFGGESTATMGAGWIRATGRAGEMSDLRPGSTLMARRLTRLGYDEANAARIIGSIHRGDQVVVGENMRLANAGSEMAESVGGRPVTYAPGKWTGLTRNSPEATRRWIRYWAKDKGATIIDIGRQPTVRPLGPSPRYRTENRFRNRWRMCTPFVE